MTEEKDNFEKSAKSDSTEPEEPIDISGLMNSDDEDEDDGIIELKDEVTPPSKSDDEIINRMANIWNPYQCMVTFNLSRSTSFYESGIGRGMGFRDSNQDLLGSIHLAPKRARERIMDIAATQLEDRPTEFGHRDG